MRPASVFFLVLAAFIGGFLVANVMRRYNWKRYFPLSTGTISNNLNTISNTIVNTSTNTTTATGTGSPVVAERSSNCVDPRTYQGTMYCPSGKKLVQNISGQYLCC